MTSVRGSTTPLTIGIILIRSLIHLQNHMKNWILILDYMIDQANVLVDAVSDYSMGALNL